MLSSRRRNQVARLGMAMVAYPFSAAAPRRSNRWVFGHAGDIFAGNPKYLFLWVRLYRPDILATWITGSEVTHRLLAAHGLPVARRWSMKGIRAVLRAEVFAFSHDPADVNAPLSRGAFHLNLWHGVGVKALHMGARPATRLRSWVRSFIYIPYQRVVSTSDMMQAHFAYHFALPPERVPQLGYPRLDGAEDARLGKMAKAVDPPFALRGEGVREVYLYLPTYRDTGRPFLDEALPDLDVLARVLEARRAVLYVKPHPRTPYTLPSDHASIRRWPDAVDFQPYLSEIDGFITDYSSVLYDYLAVRRQGAILYIFDYEAYVDKDRALAHSFDANVAGVRARTFEDLCAVLSSGSALQEIAQDDVDRVRARFWGGSSRPASPAVIAYVERELASPKDETQRERPNALPQNET